MNQYNKSKAYIVTYSRKHPYVPGVKIADQDIATIGAYHTADIPYWFGTQDAFNMFRTEREWTPLDRKLSEQMSAMLIAFANAPFYGGGMRLAPKAAMDDQKLDFCLVRRVNKLRLSYLFPSVYFGRHLRIPEVDYFQGDRLRLETDRPLDVYADGEYVCHTPIEVGIAPNAFQVIVPR